MKNSKKKISKSDVKKHTATDRGKTKTSTKALKQGTKSNAFARASKNLTPGILSGDKGSGNYYKYDIKASQVSDEDIKKMTKLANDRLYKLEKSGQSEFSREYKMVEHYAIGDPNGKGSIYNVSEDYDRIRFTSSTKGMTQEERSYYVNTLRNFLRAETSTIKGTKAAINKAFETYKSHYGANIPDMTAEQYARLWKTYREWNLPDKLSHEGYNAFLELAQNSNLYDLTDNQLDAAMAYLRNSEETSTSGIVGELVYNLPFINWVG